MISGFLTLLKAERFITVESSMKFVTSNPDAEIFVSGSLAQTSFAAGFFFRDGSVFKNMDIDLAYIISNFTLKKECIHNVERKPAHLRLLHSCLPKEIAASLDINDQQTKYLKPNIVKNYAQMKIQTKNKPNINRIRNICDLFWRNKAVVELAEWSVIITKATCQISYAFLINSQPTINVTLDTAFLFKTGFVPNVMKKFKERTTFPIPDELFQYIFIIPKPSLQEKTDPNTTEWSYSFTHIENNIFAEQLTETQKLVYLIFKSIVNKWLKPLKPNTISSYICKTLLLWKCHNLPPENPYWNGTNTVVIIAAIQGLFEDFVSYLRTGFLPCYFVEQSNVLEKFDQTLQKECIEQIKNVIMPNMSHLIEWPEIREAIRLVEIGAYVKQKGQDTLKAFHQLSSKGIEKDRKQQHAIELN